MARSIFVVPAAARANGGCACRHPTLDRLWDGHRVAARPAARTPVTDVRGYDVLPDGRVISTTAGDAANAAMRPEVRVVLNWFEELKRLAPAN